MENNENFVEQTENVEQTTEESVVVEQPKTFTQEELDAAIGKAKARERSKIEKQYKREYGELLDVLEAGTGKRDVGELTGTLRGFYENNGVKINKKPEYAERDIQLLAKAEAAEFINAGYEDVVDEVERLAELGVDRMTAREKALFKVLAEHRQSMERTRELSSIGVTEDVYNSEGFKEFAAKFAPNTPIKDIYDIYSKTQPKKEYKSMGSMKQTTEKGAKDYYSPDEIAKLTEDDLRDPKVWEAVRRSMTGR
jgi:hypothetical protein